MRLYKQKTSEKEQRSIEKVGEQTLYALAIHYIQLMVYVKLPLDISFSSNIRHSIYNHVSHIINDEAGSLTSDFYHSVNDPLKHTFFFIHFFKINLILVFKIQMKHRQYVDMIGEMDLI